MIGRWLPLLLVLIVVSAVATPILWLESTVARSRACFSAQREPRGAELPDCALGLGVVARLRDIPFMARHAERVGEEMKARMAMMRYVDAAVGAPSREGLAEHHEALAATHQAVTWGTGRLVLDELGPPLPVRGPAELAMDVGDPAGLDRVAERHAHHAATRRALEEAILRGDLRRAREIAERHVGRPDEELRLTVAAALCAMGDADRGMAEARAVETRRAKDRKADFERAFGSARVVVEACAHHAGLEAPAIPSYGYAGDWDHRARLMALRMRLFREQAEGCDMTELSGCRSDPVFAENLAHLIERLRYRKPRAYRLETLALVVEAFPTAEGARRIAREQQGEPSYQARMPLEVAAWVDPPRDEPFLTAEAWRRAARHVEQLLDEEDDDEEQRDDGAEDEPAGVLSRAAQAMWWRAAMVHALAGDLRRADEALSRAERDEPVRRQIGSAVAALVSGDRSEARRRIEAAAPQAQGRSALPAELAMPDRAEAERRLPSSSRLAEVRAWLELALGLRSAPDGPLPPRVAALGPERLPQSASARAATLERLLDRWASWLAAPPESRRAHRYVLFDHRGDLPEDAALPWTFAASLLVEGAAPTSVWLDAVLALDRSRFSLRRYAMLRWRVAAWRGHERASVSWQRRYRALAARSVDRDVAELMRALGI